MFNKVILVGSLTRDCEMRYSQSGTGIANTAIATNRKFTKDGQRQEEVCFVDITFFGKSAEIANQYLRKGSKVLIEGRLNFDQWTTQDGSKRSKHSIIVESMQMLDSKNDAQDNAQNAGQYQHPPQQDYNTPRHTDYQPQQQQMPQGQGNIPIEQENIPF